MRVTAIVHHLVKGVGEIRVKEFFGDAAPSLGSGRSAAGDDLEESLVELLSLFGGYAKSRDVLRIDGVEGFSRHFCRLCSFQVLFYLRWPWEVEALLSFPLCGWIDFWVNYLKVGGLIFG